MEIAIPRIASADLLVETLWLIGRRARGIRSDVRVAIWAATTAEAWVAVAVWGAPEVLVVLAASAAAAESVELAESVAPAVVVVLAELVELAALAASGAVAERA